ncbi:814_t:CDS:2 [Ambispora leptoticha]|uniref:814_t:CDS:1 n=1 Tax=Ambispora leptoticha TaxID=144679 RepID=A0A9N8VAN0_9GLOM|nr:814_t:CDS:2 [Ambispora leptoticha]
MSTLNLEKSDGLLEASSEPINPDTYFITHTAPESLEADEKRVKEFVGKHAETLEQGEQHPLNILLLDLLLRVKKIFDLFLNQLDYYNTYFLEAGYAVIFMHRKYSLQPYNRHFSQYSALDLMELKSDGSICVSPAHMDKIKNALAKYQEFKRKEMILMIDFLTVNDYLFLLRSVTQAMNQLKRCALYYLAAAAEHKIQSGAGPMTLKMDQVPKFLRPLVSNWAPQGYTVSFKLETEPDLLIPKSRQALLRYGHQIVIGNLLTKRKSEVNLITHDAEMELKLSKEEMRDGVEIESRIVNELVKRHEEWIKQRTSNDF